MNEQFASLSHIALHPEAGCVSPPEPAELVHLTDSALEVFTDFRTHWPVTVEPALSIQEALDKMKWTGVRLLLVNDEPGRTVGVITSRDIEGEKPVRFSQATGKPRERIKVSDIMTSQHEIEVLNWISVRGAEVGHIVATLREAERHHLLVVEAGEQGEQKIIGLFSATQISNQLGWEVTEVLGPAHSLAEMLVSG